MDRREEFKSVMWAQGRLLDTHNTRRWTAEQRAKDDAIERKMAFAHFSAEDEGRGRVCVFVYDTAEECSEAVNAHNTDLKKVGSNAELRDRPTITLETEK
jgi:hypothetical protein